MSFSAKIKEKLRFLRNIGTGGGTEALLKGIQKDLSGAVQMMREHLDTGGTTIPENDAFYLAGYYVEKAMDACPEDIPAACMRCSLAIHELKAFPDVPAATDTVRILEDVYARLEQLHRNI